eukprot:346003_1
MAAAAKANLCQLWGIKPIDMDEKIAELKVILKNVEDIILISLLKKCDLNIERCIDLHFSNSTAQSAVPNTNKISLKPAQTEISSQDEDVEIIDKSHPQITENITSLSKYNLRSNTKNTNSNIFDDSTDTNMSNKENQAIFANINTKITNKKRKLKNIDEDYTPYDDYPDDDYTPKKKKRKINSKTPVKKTKRKSQKKTKTKSQKIAKTKSQKKSKTSVKKTKTKSAKKPRQSKRKKSTKEEKDEDTEMNDNPDLKTVEPNTLSEDIRKAIYDAYYKFLANHSTGAYALRTVCIEFGKKPTKSFINKLLDVKWIPKTYKLPDGITFKTSINKELLDYVCRLKFYRISHKEDDIFKGGNAEHIAEKLQALDKDGLADYFLPRLTKEIVDKNDKNDKKKYYSYSSWVMMRLNWNKLKQLHENNTLKSTIETILKKDDVKCLFIAFEGVTTEIDAKLKLKMKAAIHGIDSLNEKERKRMDEYCPFGTRQQFLDMITGEYFKNKNIHFKCFSKAVHTAEYLSRVTRSLAEYRIKSGWSVNMNISVDKKDNFFEMLLQQIVGVSGIKAEAIVNVYPTAGALTAEYKKLSKEEGELLLRDIEVDSNGNSNNLRLSRIGGVVSKKVYDEYYGDIAGDV